MYVILELVDGRPTGLFLSSTFSEAIEYAVACATENGISERVARTDLTDESGYTSGGDYVVHVVKGEMI